MEADGRFVSMLMIHTEHWGPPGSIILQDVHHLRAAGVANQKQQQPHRFIDAKSHLFEE